MQPGRPRGELGRPDQLVRRGLRRSGFSRGGASADTGPSIHRTPLTTRETTAPSRARRLQLRTAAASVIGRWDLPPVVPPRPAVVVVPPRPAVVVVPPRAVTVPAAVAIPASGSPVPVVAAVPIPVIAPARVPELSWAPLREGPPWLSLRLGCGAHSGQAQCDGYSEYGCNKTCKRCKGFHVYSGTPGTWAENPWVSQSPR
jgi:hypothetical protein